MVTEDTVYQGRVRLVQPEAGFRAGTDSLLLAAALQAPAKGGEVLELGCGCGGALLPAAYRLSATVILGVDSDEQMVTLAQRGVMLNGFDGRVSAEQGEASEWRVNPRNCSAATRTASTSFSPIPRISSRAESRNRAKARRAPISNRWTSPAG